MMLVILGYSVGGTLYNVLRTFQFAQENMQKAGADASSVAAVELILIGVYKFMMTLIMTFAKRTGRAAFGDDGMVFVFPLQVRVESHWGGYVYWGGAHVCITKM